MERRIALEEQPRAEGPLQLVEDLPLLALERARHLRVDPQEQLRLEERERELELVAELPEAHRGG